MTKGDLDGVMPFGRPMKPVAMGVSVLMLTLLTANITQTGVFGSLPLGHIIIALAGVSVGLLVVGWVAKNQVMAEFGLLAATIVYVTRASFVLFAFGWQHEGIYLSAGGAIIAGGSYLLERWDTHRHRVA